MGLGCIQTGMPFTDPAAAQADPLLHPRDSWGAGTNRSVARDSAFPIAASDPPSDLSDLRVAAPGVVGSHPAPCNKPATVSLTRG
jgi:hypothetical protein